ncbi:MAG: hypothetical protein COW00_04490 [Bdellovibrio sp. CG12_big_fil_rev_8_21_14_0_65_39_13]|nr:MAG: hypothetical protein COW78_12690 [Bdellovibrio sp. CG22_combo_CG10-13_8_21_14_all_39_27]PIQ61067.1 MAG: hypothetical protein COW00_04490 [Bdellovibrio sp. CG12_big_fil_rev_8_21_14_0_65_39_13]PIR36835.1 MAG: hypothetical protein COV37_01510 [Bdellovibrio sp. CG11_big_fil_rev_8_21_14_0_20_39_38]
MELGLEKLRYWSETMSSREIDVLIGFDIRQIERNLLDAALKISPDANISGLGRALHDGNQTWIGLDERTLCTGYDELFKMFDIVGLENESCIIDLGAAYGRMGLVMQSLQPSAHYLGYEYVPERVEEGNRILKQFHCDNALLVTQDLFADSFQMPEADIYFIYEYGRIDHIKHTLEQVQEASFGRKVKLIVRGDSTNSMIYYHHPWIASVYKPRHEENFSVYSNYCNI